MQRNILLAPPPSNQENYYIRKIKATADCWAKIDSVSYSLTAGPMGPADKYWSFSSVNFTESSGNIHELDFTIYTPDTWDIMWQYAYLTAPLDYYVYTTYTAVVLFDDGLYVLDYDPYVDTITYSPPSGGEKVTMIYARTSESGLILSYAFREVTANVYGNTANDVPVNMYVAFYQEGTIPTEISNMNGKNIITGDSVNDLYDTSSGGPKPPPVPGGSIG